MARIGIIRVKKLIDGLLKFIKADYLEKTALQGVLVHTTPSSVGVKKKDTITLSGTSGSVFITDTVNLKMKLTFVTSLTQSAANFVTSYASLYLAQGIVLTSSTNNLIFEATLPNVNFISPTVTDMSSESFLARCFDTEDVCDGVDYKTLAIEIFTRTESDSRHLETRLLFDQDRASLPTIHVREPAKNKGAQDSIGYMDEELFENSDGGFQYTRRRSFISQYEIMITSMNRHEVIIIEEVLIALLIGSQDTLAMYSPFYQFNFTVRELIANNQLMPDPLFIKALMLNMNYDKSYPDLSENESLTSILFTANLLTE